MGLLICKIKDNVLAQYATESIEQPIGISEYQLSNMIAENHKRTLPSIEEIEKELVTDRHVIYLVECLEEYPNYLNL